MGPKKKVKGKQKDAESSGRKRDLKAAEKANAKNAGYGSEEENAEEDGDEDNDDRTENIDPMYRKNLKVIIFFTLPSGQEEILTDYDMCFADKAAYLANKDNLEMISKVNGVDGFGGDEQNDSN